jgi:hypothetical protein
VGEGLVFEDANGAHEVGALGLPAGLQGALLRPPCELAVRRELERLHFLA